MCFLLKKSGKLAFEIFSQVAMTSQGRPVNVILPLPMQRYLFFN